jgi:signal transduction histidine kinase/DNA-binding NarL/FixJ family response regulator
VSAVVDDRALPPVAVSVDAARRARLRDCTVLLVDDEEANLDLLEALLAGEGYTRLVRTADAREVPALDARHAPDLVLLDLHMPHRHGLAVLGDLRAATPTGDYRPVLVLTADATEEARDRALALGARDFVTKPFDAAEVLLRVENLLDTRVLHVEERRARERAEAAEARSALLAEWSRLLAASLDPATALGHLPRLLVPRWAAACVAVVRVDGVATPAAEGFADASAATWAPALRARAAALCAAPPHADGEAAADIAAVPVPGGVQLAGARIDTSGGPVGALVLAHDGDRAGTAGPDQALVDELAARAGLAAEHARLLAAAELATRERERLLAVVAHDLRNPLGAVAMYAEMLTSLQPDREEGSDADTGVAAYTRRALATIHTSTVAMQRLVEDLLDASSLRGDALRVHRSEQRVGAPFEAADRMLRPLANAAGITLVVQGEGDAAERLGAIDGERVVQLLSNLVGNAVKFTPPGGTIHVRYGVDDGELTASVADTGPGIAPDELPHLFTAFWRGDRDGARGREDGRGAGLGLWIARAIVEAHDGALRVDSRPGEGATFHFTLPLADPGRRWED